MFPIFTIILSISGLTTAFFPVDWRENAFGNGGTSHESQTRDVFAELAIEFFGIYDLTGSMVNAQRTIITANAQVDFPVGYEAREHFDNEQFNAGQALLNERRDNVKTALEDGDAAAARNALGRALHTLQDFYAHSNWVELLVAKGGGLSTYDGLGTSDSLRFPESNPSARSCIACNALTGDVSPKPGFFECPDCKDNLATAGLTSGYFELPALTVPQGVKCAHGGRAESVIKSPRPYPGINKDSLACEWSPHFDSHNQAVQLSKEGTREYFRQIRKDVTPSQLKLLFGVGPSIGFAIDTTGSMSDVIADTRAQAISIVDARLTSTLDPIKRDEPSLYVVVPFNDPTFGGFPAVVDPEAFKTQLGFLSASGGGDCPEFSLSGLNQALEQMDAGGNLFLITDAATSPSDPVSAGAVIAKAKKKGIAIWAFIYDSSCSSDPTYAAIAQATGGQQWSLPKSDASSITSLVDKVARADYVTLLKLRWQTTKDFASIGHLRRRDTSGPIAVPVDSTMYGITFSIEGKDASLSITRPDSSEVAPTDAGVSIVEVRDGVIISVDNPAQGIWNVVVGGTGNGTLIVSGLSPLRLSAFDFVSLQGRPGHDGYFPIDTPSPSPGSGSSHPAIAFIDGNFSTAGFELRNALGRTLGQVPLDQGSGKAGAPPEASFFGPVPFPNADSLLYVTGKDAKGAPFLRVLPSSVIPLGNGTFNTTTTPPSNNSTTASLPHGTGTGVSSGLPHLNATGGGGGGGSSPPYPTSSGDVPYSYPLPTAGTGYSKPGNYSPTSYGGGGAGGEDTYTVM